MSQTSDLTHNNLRQQREAAGLTIQDVRDGMLTLLPKRLVPTLSTIARIETGAIAKPDTLHLYAAAKVIGCRLSDISLDAAAELETIRDLVVSTSRCITAHREQAATV